MVTSEQIDFIRSLVIEKKLTVSTAILIEYMIMNAQNHEYFMGKTVCDISVENLAKEFKLELPALRYHIRKLEKMGLIEWVFIVNKGGTQNHISGYNEARKLGARLIRSHYFWLKFIDQWGEK